MNQLSALTPMETMDGAGLAGMLRARAVPLDGREREGRGRRGNSA